MCKDKSKIDFTLMDPGGKLKEEGPVYKGNDFSQPDITCQGCGYLIAQGVPYDSIKGIFTNCPRCGTLYQHTQ